MLSRIPPEISLDLNGPREYEQFLHILPSQHAEQTDHPTCSIQLESHTESEKWVRVGTSLHASGLTSLTVPSATRPPCTTTQTSVSVDTTTAEVLPISETSCNLVLSTVYEDHHSEFHLCLTSHTLKLLSSLWHSCASSCSSLRTLCGPRRRRVFSKR